MITVTLERIFFYFYLHSQIDRFRSVWLRLCWLWSSARLEIQKKPLLSVVIIDCVVRLKYVFGLDANSKTPSYLWNSIQYSIAWQYSLGVISALFLALLFSFKITVCMFDNQLSHWVIWVVFSKWFAPWNWIPAFGSYKSNSFVLCLHKKILQKRKTGIGAY